MIMFMTCLNSSTEPSRTMVTCSPVWYSSTDVTGRAGLLCASQLLGMLSNNQPRAQVPGNVKCSRTVIRTGAYQAPRAARSHARSALALSERRRGRRPVRRPAAIAHCDPTIPVLRLEGPESKSSQVNL